MKLLAGAHPGAEVGVWGQPFRVKVEAQLRVVVEEQQAKHLKAGTVVGGGTRESTSLRRLRARRKAEGGVPSKRATHASSSRLRNEYLLAMA